MARPTFIIAGAPKCGTTAVWAMLDQHPDVFMSQVKEPGFFTQTPPGATKPVGRLYAPYARGLDWYESLFDGGADKAVRGEASTHYFTAADSSKLIYQYDPGIKIIFFLRDPADRAYSHYYQDLKSGAKLEPIEEIFDENAVIHHYLRVSHYKEHLLRYREQFPDDQIAIFLMEDLKREPEQVLAELYRFIGISPPYKTPDQQPNYNPRRLPRIPILQRVLHRIRSSAWTTRIPGIIRLPLARSVQGLWEMNLQPASVPQLPNGLRTRMIHHFREDIEFVERILGRDLEEWKM